VNRRAQAWVWLIVVIVGAVIPLTPGLVPGRTLSWRDSALLQGPVRSLVVEEIRQGRLPVWNMWEGGGQPLLAQSFHSALHPVSVLVATFSESLDVLLVGFVMTAASGAWFAARTLGASPAAAAVAAFAFALSGYVLGMTSNALYLAGAATLPWIAGALRVAASRRAGWLFAAAAVAAGGLAGDPGSLAAGIIIGLALAWETRGLRGAGWAVLGVAVGLGLSAVQLLPTWSFLASTVRGAGLGPAGLAEQWSLDLLRLPEVISPGLFVGLPRSYRSPVFEALGSRAEGPFPWAPSIFVGAPVIALALAGAWRSRTARVLALLALLFLWISLGRRAGASQILGGIPVWGALRYWEKFVAPLSLCLGLAAAIGAGTIGGAESRSLARGSALAAAVAGAVGIAALVLLVPGGGVGAIYGSRLALGLVFAAAALILLAVVVRRTIGNPGLGMAVTAALVLVQSAAASPFALHFGSMSALRVRPPSPVADAPGPRVVTPLARNFEEADGEWDAIDRTHASHYRGGRPSTNVSARLQNGESSTGFGSVRSGIVAGAGPLKWALLRRLGATHVVAPFPEDDEDRETLRQAIGDGALGPSAPVPGIQVWEVTHRPWASFAKAVRATAGLRSAARALGEELAAGAGTVVVEADRAPPVAPGLVRAIERRSTEVVVEAESDGPALLVVNDAFAPGWTATIDGVPTEILAADVLVRAVRWPTGRHTLVMRYDPPEIALGIAVSGAAAVLALLLLLGSVRRNLPPG
jgi:hypothetical protein